MSVTVTLRGRLGNNLFQYAFGRLLAERWGLAFRCRRGDRTASIRGLSAGTLEAARARFPRAPLALPGRRAAGPTRVIGIDGADRSRVHLVDLAPILADASPRRLLVDGYFQRSEYYAPHRARLREWFGLPPAESPEAGPRDVLVCIRRGADYGLRGWTLPVSFYERVLEGLPRLGRVYLCGVGIDEAVRGRLARYGAVHLDVGPIEQLRLFSRFKRVVLSNSTFSWWGAFLSDVREIHAPHSNGTMFGLTGFDRIDLDLGAPRYRRVDAPEAARFERFIVNLSPGRWRGRGSGAERPALEWLCAKPGRTSWTEACERFGEGPVRGAVRRLARAGRALVCGRHLD